MNKKVYEVNEINQYIKRMFAQDFLLGSISIKGEVSNCKYHSSGHIYFTLKDGKGAISAVMFAGYRRGLTFPMKDGDKVVVTGSVEVYERDGKYQLYAKQIEKEGAGDLYLRFEALKKELEEMGMFAREYKKPIPRFAMKIGVVTAPTGAAIQDIRNISSRRNPYAEILLYPALVQGQGAAESIVKGIQTLDAMGLDVIIVGRGGGSLEDLWAFNEEPVVRAIFECHTPIISAVGHETDTTLSDYAADMRAPTPSAAAELAVFDAHSFLMDVQDAENRMNAAFSQRLLFAEERLKRLQAELNAHNPLHLLGERKIRLEAYTQRYQNALSNRKKELFERMRMLSVRLDAASPLKQLSKGYGYVCDADGNAVTDVDRLKKDDALQIHVQNGKIGCLVTTLEKINRG